MKKLFSPPGDWPGRKEAARRPAGLTGMVQGEIDMIDDSMDEESTEPLIEEVQNDEAEPMQGTGPATTCRESLDILLCL